MKLKEQLKKKLLTISLVSLDAILLHLITLLTFYIRYSGNIYEGNLNAYLSVFIPFIVIIIFVAHLYDLYRMDNCITYIDIIYRSFQTVTLGYFIVVTYVFYSRAFAFPRTVILISWFLNVGGIASWRIIFKLITSAVIKPTNTLIIGTNNDAKLIAHEFERYSSKNYKITGHLPFPKDGIVDELISSIEANIGKNDVRFIIISTNHLTRNDITTLFLKFYPMGIRMAIHPSLYEILTGNIELKQIAGIPLLDIKIGEKYPWYNLIKRVIDILFSFLSLLLLSPLLLLCAIAVKLDSKGPVFYTQERCGKDGRIFKIIKFRTMYTDAEQKGPTLAKENDPRVTRVGSFFRRSHLDELPQFFNVFMGDMSVVGPRPERPFFVKQYIKKFPAYPMRLIIKPGITGLAQVHGRYDTTIDNKLKYDLVYINNMSPLLDLKIIILTIKSVLTFRDKI